MAFRRLPHHFGSGLEDLAPTITGRLRKWPRDSRLPCESPRRTGESLIFAKSPSKLSSMKNAPRLLTLTGPSKRRHHLIIGNCLDPQVLDILGDLSEFSALVTDPPYSSGALHIGGRRATATTKYQQTNSKKTYQDHLGDSLDQRSWFRWCTTWLSQLRGLCETSAYSMIFSDWRQLPSITDALQWANWTWRGVAVWDKTEGARAPSKSYFRTQAEFVVWGSNGKLPASYERGRPIAPGVFRSAIDSKKVHLCQKPVSVMAWLLSLLPQKAERVLDPFAGSGSTVLAADTAGLSCVAVEEHEGIAAQAVKRLEGSGFRVEE